MAATHYSDRTYGFLARPKMGLLNPRTILRHRSYMITMVLLRLSRLGEMEKLEPGTTTQMKKMMK